MHAFVYSEANWYFSSCFCVALSNSNPSEPVSFSAHQEPLFLSSLPFYGPFHYNFPLSLEMGRTLRILIPNPTAHNSVFCELRKLPSCPLSGGAMSKPRPQDGIEEEMRHIQKLKESLSFQGTKHLLLCKSFIQE